jgi:hypothetical protein
MVHHQYIGLKSVFAVVGAVQYINIEYLLEGTKKPHKQRLVIEVSRYISVCGLWSSLEWSIRVGQNGLIEELSVHTTYSI